MDVYPIHTRPTRELLLRLPLLPTTPDHRIDYERAAPDVVRALADSLETVIATFNLGLSAVGVILAHASAEVGSEIGSETIESLGWFIAEASDMTAALQSLAHSCRYYTTDYTPPQPKSVPMVRF
mgnify:CR=1 FL=1